MVGRYCCSGKKSDELGQEQQEAGGGYCQSIGQIEGEADTGIHDHFEILVEGEDGDKTEVAVDVELIVVGIGGHARLVRLNLRSCHSLSLGMVYFIIIPNILYLGLSVFIFFVQIADLELFSFWIRPRYFFDFIVIVDEILLFSNDCEP